MVDAGIINLLLIVEIISIIIATIVIALELWIHKSTVQILKRMNQFSKEMDGHIGRQVDKIDEHVRELDEHSMQMEKSLKGLLKENEAIYKNICQTGIPEGVELEKK
jgi:hypothetical protein